MKVSVLLLGIALLLTACSTFESHRAPNTDLSRIRNFYVVHRLSDNNHIDNTIVDHLRSLGLEASAGPTTMMPQRAEAIVTYRDEWAWDFKTYLVQLDIEIHQAHTNRPLARASYRQPTIITKSTATVVEKIFTALLSPNPQK